MHRIPVLSCESAFFLSFFLTAIITLINHYKPAKEATIRAARTGKVRWKLAKHHKESNFLRCDIQIKMRKKSIPWSRSQKLMDLACRQAGWLFSHTHASLSRLSDSITEIIQGGDKVSTRVPEVLVAIFQVPNEAIDWIYIGVYGAISIDTIYWRWGLGTKQQPLNAFAICVCGMSADAVYELSLRHAKEIGKLLNWFLF